MPVIYLLRVPPSRRSDLEAVIPDTGTADVYAPSATQMDISDIPSAALEFLLPSRYCEVDSELMDFAWRTFLQARLGRERVQAICDFVHGHLQFDYQQARTPPLGSLFSPVTGGRQPSPG
jgi:transglutaminase-like putative cysteine protease